MQVRHNRDRSRYELWDNETLVGIADYWVSGDRVVIPHTEIVGHRQGRGLGAVLVQGALEDVRASGRTVLPQCWYVAQFIREHPEFRDLLAA